QPAVARAAAATVVTAPGPAVAPAPTQTTRTRGAEPVPAPNGELAGGELTSPPIAFEPTPTLGPAELQLADVAFQFQDAPQPGANVQLSLAIHNPTDAPGGLVRLDLPLAWLSGYAIQGIEPLPADATLNGQRV